MIVGGRQDTVGEARAVILPGHVEWVMTLCRQGIADGEGVLDPVSKGGVDIGQRRILDVLNDHPWPLPGLSPISREIDRDSVAAEGLLPGEIRDRRVDDPGGIYMGEQIGIARRAVDGWEQLRCGPGSVCPIRQCLGHRDIGLA